MKKVFVLLVLFLCIYSQFLFSQNKNTYKYFISPSVGIIETTHKVEYFTYGMTVGYYCSSHIRIDALYNYADARKDLPNYKNVSTEAILLTLPSNIYKGKIISNVSIGAGLQQGKGYPGIDNKNEFIIPVQVGLEYNITNHVGIALSTLYPFNGITEGNGTVSLVFKM